MLFNMENIDSCKISRKPHGPAKYSDKELRQNRMLIRNRHRKPFVAKVIMSYPQKQNDLNDA